MPSSEDADFVKRLRETFRLEAEEHLQALNAAVGELLAGVSEAASRKLVERAFREVHTLKGAAGAVNLPAVAGFCRALENALAQLKSASGPIPTAHLRALDDAAVLLGDWIPAALAGQEDAPAQVEAVARALAGADGTAPGAAAASRAQPEGSNVHAETSTATGAVRLRAAQLNQLLRYTEELRLPKLAAARRAAQLRELIGHLEDWSRQRKGRAADLRHLRRFGTDGGAPGPGALARTLEFLDRTDAAVTEFKTLTRDLARAAEADSRVLAGAVEALHEGVKSILMAPVASLFEGYPRLVRELAGQSGKSAELRLSGADFEVDRRILQELRTPLIHLLRNALDHGIEAPARREAAGKAPAGTISIAARALADSRFEIAIADDGAGLEPARIREAAVRSGGFAPQDMEALDRQGTLDLIFGSGVTTANAVTELSGRGLGLAIVREHAERLGGTITVASTPGAGTSFRLELPATLSASRGLQVHAGGAAFLIPVAAVERVVRVPAAAIATVENRETLLFAGRAISLVPLAALLGLKPSDRARESWIYAVVVAAGGRQLALEVDQIVAEQEMVLKILGPRIASRFALRGATALDDRSVLPVLGVADLVQAASELSARPPAVPDGTTQPKQRTILVVEDSITARSLLKNILESAGYRVKVAADGGEAFTLLKTEPFDLVVSDIEMPRMNGLEMTAKIRSDRELSDLPVVLITALESREDRERGIDAGASAYIVKSSLEDRNLLETVSSLL